MAPAFRGKPILEAAEIEDVVAYLMTLEGRCAGTDEMNDTDNQGLTRRGALALAAGAFSIALVAPARATPESMKEVIDAFTGGKPVTEGRVKFEISLLVENGNSVPLSVNVESPMTRAGSRDAHRRLQ